MGRTGTQVPARSNPRKMSVAWSTRGAAARDLGLGGVGPLTHAAGLRETRRGVTPQPGRKKIHREEKK